MNAEIEPVRIGGRWNPSALAGFRRVGDAPAQRVVDELYADGERDAVNDLLSTLVRSDDPVPAGLPEVAKDYFQETAPLPEWADPQRIRRAQALFERAGWQVATSLFCASLPQAYAAGRGAQVLQCTGAMTTHVSNRVFETAQFVFDVADPGGLSADGRGVRAAQKVRLLHAAIRHLIADSDRWDEAAWGVPINQEDLAGTMLTFSTVVTDSLRILGVPVSDEDEMNWLHMWTVVGHYLGIDERLYPADAAQAEALMQLIRDTQWEPSRAGRELGRAIVGMMDSYMPAHCLDDLPAMMIRHLGGDRCADILGLPKRSWTTTLLRGALRVEKLLIPKNMSNPLEAALVRTGQRIMEAIVLIERGGKQAPFRLPPSLKNSLDD